MIRGKRILVTGAGGSIGSEIVQQLNRLGAEKVFCLDRDEYALYRLQLTTTGRALLTDGDMILADIQSYRSMKAVMERTRPDFVFHAAAVKQLPLLERSPDTAVLTNVMGTEHVMRTAIEVGVERIVNVSTDKAASPTSVLGYTKRMAEMIAKSYSNKGTLISSVRFGNVFASRGSFIETMQWQMANDLPITITDPGMTRYFMSIPQASSLVIEAAVLASTGHTYVLDMGEPFKITEILEKYAAFVGEKDYTVKKSGRRKGEKMSEVLFDGRETRLSTDHPKISEVSVDANPAKLLKDVHALCRGIQSDSLDNDEILQHLHQLVGEIEHQLTT